jgi:hypothetical protein
MFDVEIIYSLKIYPCILTTFYIVQCRCCCFFARGINFPGQRAQHDHKDMFAAFALALGTIPFVAGYNRDNYLYL